MALTKMIARIVANQRRQPAGAVTATNKPGPSNQRRRRLSRQRIRAKNIAGRIRGWRFKINMLLADQINIDVRKTV